MRPITAIATPASPSTMVCLDPWQGAAVGVQVVPLGGAIFTVDHSFDEGPDSLVNPVPLGSMWFDSSFVPSTGVNGAAGISFSIATAPIWIRVRLLNGVGSVRATYSQLHSPGGGAVLQSGGGAVAPSNTIAPLVTGTAAVGSILSCSTGTWSGSPTSYAYQWQRDGTNISGATASSYTVVTADSGHAVSCQVFATNSAGTSAAASNVVTPTTPPAPAIITAPAVTGVASVGSTLTCSTGTWTNSPTGYTYQWQRGGTNITAATSSTYVVQTADIGAAIGCFVTATNANGSATAGSNTVVIPIPAPVNTAAPVATGTATMGSTLTCSTGTWNYSPTGYAYQWQRAGVNISGATSSAYVTVSADVGTNVTCNVTATNASGSTSAASNAIAVVAIFPAGATAVYSTRRAVAGYAGNCLTLQTPGGTSQDIGFDGAGNLDMTAALAFGGNRVVKWFDQSGNGRDATATPYYGVLNFINGRGIVIFGQTNFIVPSGAVNGDQTLGLVMWPADGANDQFVMTHYDGSGWMIMTNHGGNSYKGVYWSNTSGSFNPTTAKLTGKSPSRLVFTRTSGSVAMYVNGVASGTVTGQGNAAPSTHINIGGYQDTNPAFTGFITEVFIYGSALTVPQLAAIDANEATIFPTIGLESPYNGVAHWAQWGPGQNINLGAVLKYEYTQSWTVFAAVQVYDSSTYKIVFTNVPNPSFGGDFPGYELWIDSDHGNVLHVKLMHNYGDTGKPNVGTYAGVWGTINVADGKKHIVAASYDGSGTAAGISLFVDGVKDTAHVESNTLGGLTIVNANQFFWVGNQNGIAFGLGGAMSHFQLDKVKRSDSYIAAIYPGSGTPLPAVDANTAVCLLLTDGAGTTAADSSGNGLNGTLTDGGMWIP